MLGVSSNIESVFREIEQTCGLTAMDLETAGLLLYVADRKNILIIKKLLHLIIIREDIEHKLHKKNYFIKTLGNQKSKYKDTRKNSNKRF